MKRRRLLASLLLVLTLLLVACGGATSTTEAPASGETEETTPAEEGAAEEPAAEEPAAEEPAAEEPAEEPAAEEPGEEGATSGEGAQVTVWLPNADACDPAEEWGLIRCQIERFDEENDDIAIEVQGAPIDGWTDYINSAAFAGDLPDIMAFDGPTLANFAWAGYLQPLDEYVPEDVASDFLPSTMQQNVYGGQTYAVSAFDGGFGIYGNREHLEAAGVRIPTSVDDAWTREEFEEALAALQEVEGVEYAMDMKMNYGQGEWFTYGFSPILQSFGGDLIDRETMQAEGTLNGPESVEAMEFFQSLIENGYVNPAPAGDTDFDEGRSSLSWVGHWMYGRYAEALGDNLVVIPMPKLGDQAVTGLGSWGWSMTTNAEDPAAAWRVMEYLTQPEQILELTAVNGAVPARQSALADSELYGEGGPMAVLAEQLQTIAVARPVTPAYPVITSAFAEAVNNIASGGDVQEELDAAAQAIDEDIEANQGYAPQQ